MFPPEAVTCSQCSQNILPLDNEPSYIIRLAMEKGQKEPSSGSSLYLWSPKPCSFSTKGAGNLMLDCGNYRSRIMMHWLQVKAGAQSFPLGPIDNSINGVHLSRAEACGVTRHLYQDDFPSCLSPGRWSIKERAQGGVPVVQCWPIKRASQTSCSQIWSPATASFLWRSEPQPPFSSLILQSETLTFPLALHLSKLVMESMADSQEATLQAYLQWLFFSS